MILKRILAVITVVLVVVAIVLMKRKAGQILQNKQMQEIKK
jgi:hypothetical protein